MNDAPIPADGPVFEPADPGVAVPGARHLLTDEQLEAVESSMAEIAEIATAMRTRAPVYAWRRPASAKLLFGSASLDLQKRLVDDRRYVCVGMSRRGHPQVHLVIPVAHWSFGPPGAIVPATRIASMAQDLLRSYLDHVRAAPTTPASPDMAAMRDGLLAHLLRFVDRGLAPVGLGSPRITGIAPRDGMPGSVTLRFGGMKKGTRRIGERDGLRLLPPIASRRMLVASVTDLRGVHVALMPPELTVGLNDLPISPIERIRLMRLDSVDDLPPAKTRRNRVYAPKPDATTRP